MHNQIAKYLLIALILSLGFGQLLRFDFFGVPIYLHDILVLAILVTQVPYLVKNYKVRNLVIPLSLKIFLAGLTIGWVYALTQYQISDLFIPSLYTLRLLAYLALYLTLKRSNMKIPATYFLVSALVCCLIGLLQYFLLPDMRLFQYLGWDDHLNRLTLPHFDPAFTSVMLALALLSISLKRWFVSLLLSFAILLTYARSTWLSLALILTYFTLKNKKFNYLIIGICLLVIPILFLPKKFGEGTNLFRTYSITSRFESDLSYVKKYNWDLLAGRGMNTLILDTAPTVVASHATGPNNSYLYLLLTSGVLGLAGWGMFMYSLYTKSLHKPMLIFFFVASLFNNVMFYPFALLWILLVEATVPT